MAGFRITDCTARRSPGRLLRQIDKLMRGLIDERLTVIDMSYSQWATLKIVREGIVATASELARELGHTSGATTRLIDALEQRGYLDRLRDTGDRRVVRLIVTPAGDAAADRGLPIVLDLWNEMVADFGQAEADQFVETLSKLLGTIEAKIGGRESRLANAA